MRPAALLFDMDGTLTRPMLDFPAIKAEMGIGHSPILEALAEMDQRRRAEAEAILLRHEDVAAARSSLNEGCLELMEWIEQERLPLALITRNSRRSAEVVVARHGLKMGVLIARDEGMFKPDPAPLWLACQRMGVNASEAWMIGDGRYDIEAGLAAGMKTVWISHRRPRDFAAEPWRVANDLSELNNLLRTAVSD